MVSRFPLIARHRFELEALDEIRLPVYAGSAWRGLLGHGLKRAVCVTRQPRCDGCLLVGSCVYSTVFESPALEHEAKHRFTAVPHPFVLVLDRDGPRYLQPGDVVQVGLNLIGTATNAVPYLIHGLNLAGERGIGSGNGRFRVAAVFQELKLGGGDWEGVYNADSGEFRRLPAEPPEVPSQPGHVGIELLTPLRIKRDGRLVGPREFRARHLIYHLRWRLAALGAFYGRGGTAYSGGWTDSDVPDGVLLEKSLRWHDWTRYSSRQQTEMQMGGLVGRVVLDGDLVRPYSEELWLGQWTHVGKATSMGLGRYRLSDAASLPAEQAGD